MFTNDDLLQSERSPETPEIGSQNLFSEFIKSVNDRLESRGTHLLAESDGERTYPIGVRDLITSVFQTDDGAIQRDYYDSAKHARDGQPSATETFMYTASEDSLTEVRTLFDSGRNQLLTVETRLDKDAGRLFISISQDNEQQTISFQDGQPEELDLLIESADGAPANRLTCTFADGEIDKIRVNDGPLDPLLESIFKIEVLETLKTVARANGLPGSITSMDKITERILGTPLGAPDLAYTSTEAIDFLPDPTKQSTMLDLSGTAQPSRATVNSDDIQEPTFFTAATVSEPTSEVKPVEVKPDNPMPVQDVPNNPDNPNIKDVPQAIPIDTATGAPFNPDKLVASLPPQLRPAVGTVLFELTTNGKVTNPVTDALAAAEKAGRLREFILAVNIKLTILQSKITLVDETPQDAVEGNSTITIVSQNGKERVQLVRPPATIEQIASKDVRNLLSTSIKSISDAQAKGKDPTPETLTASLNAVAFNGNIDQFREVFNVEMRNGGHPFRLKDVTKPGVDGSRVFQLERAGQPLFEIVVILPANKQQAEKTTDVLTGGAPLPADVVAFTARPLADKNGSTIRQEAIEKLARSGADKQLIDGLKSIHEAAEIENSKTAPDAAKHLSTLIKLSEDGNPEAQQFVDKLTKKLGGKEQLAELLKTLKAGGVPADQALAQLKDAIPSAEVRMNELRTRAIVEALGNNPEPKQLRLARQDLEDEVAHGNKGAEIVMKTVDADLLVIDLTDPEKCEAAMEKLVKLAGTNIHAREMLIALVVPPKQEQRWKAIAEAEGWNVQKLPDLTPEIRAKLQLAAAEGLQQVGTKSGGLSVEESLALALALSGTLNEPSPDFKLAIAIKKTLSYATEKVDPVKNPAQAELQAAKLEKILTGIYKALPSTEEVGSPGSKTLARLYADLATSENKRFYFRSNTCASFKPQVEEFFKLAESGNPEAILIVNAIASGAGKTNSDASPFVEIKKDGVRSEVPGNKLAKQAADVLVRTAQSDPQVKAKVLEVLLEESLHADDKKLSPFQLTTLARVAAVNRGEIPDAVKARLFGSLHDSDTRADALRGLLIIGDGLSNDELKKLVDLLELRDVEQLSLSAHRLTSQKGAEISRLLLAKAFDSRSTESERILAISALGALGPSHADPTVVEALRMLGTKEGRAELFRELTLSTDSEKQIILDKIAKQAALSLLQIAEGTANNQVRTTAFVAFGAGDWGPAFQNSLKQDSALRQRLKDLMLENPESISIQLGVPALLNGDRTAGGVDYWKAVEPTRLAVEFRKLGLDLPDDLQLQLTKLALGNHSPKEIEDLLKRLAAFNSLPPEVRRQLTANDAPLEPGKSLQLDGKTISGSTFNRLPDEVRMRITGSIADLPNDATISGDALKGKSIPPEVFNRLDPALRKELSGSTDKLPVAQRLEFNGLVINANVFNKLPEAVRIQLFGSADLIPDSTVALKPTQVLDAQLFNSLPPSVRLALNGDSKQIGLDGKVDLRGKRLDADELNRLTPAQRQALTGSIDTVAVRGMATLPDLSRVMLTGEQINRLTADQKQLLGLPDAKIPDGMLFPLQGRTITAATFNGLPDSVKMAITGSTEALPPGRVIKDLSQDSIDAQTFNNLPPDLRKLLTGSERNIPVHDLLKQLVAGDLGAGTSRLKLLTELPAPEALFEERIKLASDKAANEERNLLALVKLREKALKVLKKDAEDGVGWFTKLGDFLDLTDGQKEFVKKQAGQIFDIVSLDKAIKEQELVVQLTRAQVQLLDIAQTNFKFAQAMLDSNGIQRADEIAAEALAKHGWPVLKQFAPDLARELAKQGVGINANPMKRLNERGLAQFDHIVKADPKSTKSGAQQGIEMLQMIKPRIGDGKGTGGMYSDAGAIRKAGFDSIDQDDRVRRLFTLAKTVHDQLGTLQQQIATMKEGDKFEEFIADARRRGVIIADALAQFSMKDGAELIELREAWKKALKDGTIKDPIAREELRKRIESLDSVLQLMAPNYSWDSTMLVRQNELQKEIARLRTKRLDLANPDDFNDPDYKRLEKQIVGNKDTTLVNGHYWNERIAKAELALIKHNQQMYQRQNLNEFLKYLGGNQFAPEGAPEAVQKSNFMTWLKKDGVELLGSIAVAVAATSIVILTFGTATPFLVLAAAGTAGMIVGSELTKEGQRAMGLRSDGSLLGDYERNTMIRDQYGAPQNMDFVEHVAMPYLKQFAQIMAMNVIGGGLGNFIGAYFSRLTGAARSLFIRENAELLTKMSANAARINAHAAVDPWYAGLLRGVNVVAKETYHQTRFAASAPAAEKSFEYLAKELGFDMKEAGAVLQFLGVVATSAVFRGMRPTVSKAKTLSDMALPKKGTLAFEYSASPEHVERYIQNAHARNSTIEFTKYGFIETTKEGLKIEWTRAEESTMTGAKPLEVTIKSFDALNDGNATPSKELKVGQADPVEAAKIQASIDAIKEPFNKKVAELEKVTKKAKEVDQEFEKRIRECEDTPTGREEAKRLRMERHVVEGEFHEQKLLIAREGAKIREAIKQSELYRQLQLAKSLADGVFPPGEYQYKLPGVKTTSVKLSIGELPAVTETGQTMVNSEGVIRKAVGDPVKVADVNKILTALDQAGIKPDHVTIFSQQNAHKVGELNMSGKYMDIRINTGVGKDIRLVYNHETGHLIDLTAVRGVFPDAAFYKMFDAYKKGFDTGIPAAIAARFIGVECTPAFQKSFRSEMLKTENYDGKVTDANDRMQLSKYCVSRSELFAEMYKLHQEELRMIKETGKKPTYNELLDTYTQGPRAEFMRGFHELYTYMCTDIFPKAIEAPKPKTVSPPKTGSAP